MNVLAAMRETADQWAGRSGRDLPVSESLSFNHLVEMLRRAETGEFSYGKQCRWLGWMQAATVAAGIATLDDMKAINKRNADDETQVMAEKIVAAMKEVRETIVATFPPDREALVEKIAAALWFEYVDDMGYPNGQPTWPEMLDAARFTDEAAATMRVKVTWLRRQAESALRIARPDLFPAGSGS